MATQALIHFQAICEDCGASCEARNARAWAHRHANFHGHKVCLRLGWLVSRTENKKAIK